MAKEDIISALKSWADDCEDFVLETDFSSPYKADAKMIREAVQIIKSLAETEAKAAAIMQRYGAKRQLVKLCEECGELIQQAAKCIDSGNGYSEDMIEEMADVSIMIMQFESLLNEYWREAYQTFVREKLNRQIKRIEEEMGGEA